MSIGPDHPYSVAVSWAQEWQRLTLTATSEAMGHYLHDCAHLAMTRTPKQALAELHRMQTHLFRHSAATFAKATKLWHEQSAELFGMPTLALS